MFSGIESSLNNRGAHRLHITDDYFPLLDDRVNRFEIRRRIEAIGIAKPFRTEAGEVFFTTFAFVPFLLSQGVSIQIYGGEKSADTPNLIDMKSGQAVRHQWAKSIYGEKEMVNLFARAFTNINKSGLTKPVHDVRIFKRLLEISGDLPYLTNSCNIRKPWCGGCPKCLTRISFLKTQRQRSANLQRQY